MTVRELVVLGVAVLALTTVGCGKEGDPVGAKGGCDAPPRLSVATGATVAGSPGFRRMAAGGHVVVGITSDQPGRGCEDVSGNRCGFDVDGVEGTPPAPVKY